MKDQDSLDILRKIQKKPVASQRELAETLGFSLGKLNYCLKALQKKDLLKYKTFRNRKIKLLILITFLPLKEFLCELNLL